MPARHAGLLDSVLAAAAARGLDVYLQVMAASPPGYRVQFSSASPADQCLGPDGRTYAARVDRNASLASRDVVDYVCALVSELAQRYPSVAGFRLAVADAAGLRDRLLELEVQERVEGVEVS